MRGYVLAALLLVGCQPTPKSDCLPALHMGGSPRADTPSSFVTWIWLQTDTITGLPTLERCQPTVEQRERWKR